MENMKLVNADLLLEKKTILWDEALGFCECVLVDDIENAPATDAEEVVRCKNCKKEWCYLRQELGENGFCSAGERKN